VSCAFRVGSGQVRYPAAGSGAGSLVIANASAATGLATAVTLMGHSAVPAGDR